MKKQWLGLCVGVCAMWAWGGVAQAAVFELDPDHSEVGFSVRHMMMSNVRGQFRQAQSTLMWDEKDVAKSSVEMSMVVSSIDTQTAKRDDHLRSPDFLDAEKFPTITFKSTKVSKAGKGLKVVGNLTIREITKPVTLMVEGPTKPIKDPFGMTRSGVHATGKISRKAFGLVWNKSLETGGVLVGEDINIVIDAEFVMKATEAPASAK